MRGADGHGTPRGRGSGASGCPQLPPGAWEGDGQIRHVGIDSDCFTHVLSAGSRHRRHRRYQSPALPRCPRHRAGLVVGWGSASGDGSTASLARRLSEDWYWGCAGALRAPPFGITKSRAGSPPPSPGGRFGKLHVTRAGRSQLAAGRQEGSGGGGGKAYPQSQEREGHSIRHGTVPGP